jgi:hypothetical protein
MSKQTVIMLTVLISSLQIPFPTVAELSGSAEVVPEQRSVSVPDSALSLVADAVLMVQYMRADREGASGVRAAWVCMLMGYCVWIAGQVWLVAVAFSQSGLWGVGVLLLNVFVAIPFLLRHWGKAWKPALLYVFGLALVVVGAEIPRLYVNLF